MKSNIQLRNFYPLISRNAEITLINKKQETLFEGTIRSLPDEFGDRTVTDFTVDCYAENFEFVIG